ncbi:hypothetical protein P154DRAFT_587718 [Amniculicola lignicola CBS 123094]|uniref:Rhodopsin domain-containing protein n=1 Tax=Amniculicola lignicola CBS 123094 TaxID=1392246 RepID=A0A6A5VXX5_9PLEO|nr:hypothetical protein P154DRAFT_587718 [Amniculicola lignicola CBS 123094]
MSDQEIHPDNHPLNQYIPIANRPETLYGTSITFCIVAVIAVSLRLYVRCRNKLWGYDDLFVFLAAVAITVGTGLTCLMPAAGMGKHYNTLSPKMKMDYYKLVWATNVCYTSSTTLIKLSILVQYLRLFDMHSRLAKRIALGLIVLISTWGITFFLLALFSCSPVAKNWNFKLEGKCVGWGSKDPDEMFATFAAHAGSNMLLDLVVLGLPIPFLSSLTREGRTRLALVALFIMGGVAAALSIARMVALSIRRLGTVPNYDPTWATPSIYIFSVSEVNIAILCASIPIFWPLVTSFSSNKILVVNEIEVRTDSRESVGMGMGMGVSLAEQGSAFGYHENGSGKGLDDGIGLGLDDKTSGPCGRASRMNVVITAMPNRVAKSAARLHKHVPRHNHNHGHRKSNSKSNSNTITISHGHTQTYPHPHPKTQTNRPPKNPPPPSTHSPTHSSQSIELIPRPSTDSTHHLSPSPALSRQNSNTSISYRDPFSAASSPGLHAPAAVRAGSIDHYRDRYVQDLVLPFEKGRRGEGGGGEGRGGTTTTVGRAMVPFDYLRGVGR